MILTVWVPPQKAGFYGYEHSYISCQSCGTEIKAGTVIGVDSWEFQQLASGNKPNNIECTQCGVGRFIKSNPNVIGVINKLVHEELKTGGFLKELIREELRTIIKEEVHDPNGTFSPPPEIEF